MATSRKYNSPSTPKTRHDLPNFIVEAMFMNKYGALPEGSWRKGSQFFKEWSKLLVKVKRVTTLDVSLEQLAWFVQFYKVTDLNYQEFGLLRWKIQHYFKWVDIDKFVAHYIALHSTLTRESSSYIENTTGYAIKQGNTNRRKTLSDILQELENGDDRTG